MKQRTSLIQLNVTTSQSKLSFYKENFKVIISTDPISSVDQIFHTVKFTKIGHCKPPHTPRRAIYARGKKLKLIDQLTRSYVRLLALHTCDSRLWHAICSWLGQPARLGSICSPGPAKPNRVKIRSKRWNQTDSSRFMLSQSSSGWFNPLHVGLGAIQARTALG